MLPIDKLFMTIYLTEKQAYEAMYQYLVYLYEITQSDYIGGLLGEMSTLEDGGTADPAVWEVWLRCVSEAKQNKVDTRLNLRPLEDK